MIAEFASECKKYLINYLQTLDANRRRIGKIQSTSIEEFISNIKDLKERRNLEEFFSLFRDIVGSGLWIGNSYSKLIISFFRFFNSREFEIVNDQRLQQLIADFSNKEIRINNQNCSKIFYALYSEFDAHFSKKNYQSKLKIPKLKTEIILIPGIFNELFSTPAFARGVQYLENINNLKSFWPNVSGMQSSSFNAKELAAQIIARSKKCPNKKFWILAYSKGGVDILHFLRDNKKFAEEKIVGVSTIASPIMGTKYYKNRIVNVFAKTNDITNDLINNYFKDGYVENSFKELLKELSCNYRKKWFKKNLDNLPKLNFYSSLAFQSEDLNHPLTFLMGLLFSNVLHGKNDGLIDVENAHFPLFKKCTTKDDKSFLRTLNLGTLQGHHWVGTTSSMYNQEALVCAHVCLLHYMKLLH